MLGEPITGGRTHVYITRTILQRTWRVKRKMSGRMDYWLQDEEQSFGACYPPGKAGFAAPGKGTQTEVCATGGGGLNGERI